MTELRTACPHCAAPRPLGDHTPSDGRVHCDACDKWYNNVAPIPLQTAKPHATKTKPAPVAQVVFPLAELPTDLVSLGFILIRYDDGTMFAVSGSWGGSVRSADGREVLRTARDMIGFIRWVNKKRQEECDARERTVE